jgi:hypothetical protein
VHTDLAANRFSTLFETVSTDPNTYAGPDVYTYAIGRSFYERLFPAASVMLGWSATAVSFPATGDIERTWAASATEDWRRFLDHRVVELRPGAPVVVSALVADPEVLPWMATVEEGALDAVDAGVLTDEQLEAMVVPTILRDAGEWAASATDPFEVVDRRTVQAPVRAYTSYKAITTRSATPSKRRRPSGHGRKPCSRPASQRPPSTACTGTCRLRWRTTHGLPVALWNTALSQRLGDHVGHTVVVERHAGDREFHPQSA